MLKQLTLPLARILSQLGLCQKLSLLGLLVLSPLWLLTHRYLQHIEDSAVRNDVLIFVGLSSALTAYFLLAIYFTERSPRQNNTQTPVGRPVQPQQQLKEYDRTLTRISAATSEVSSTADELSKMSTNSADGAREQEIDRKSVV